jgi:hypothetical protein
MFLRSHLSSEVFARDLDSWASWVVPDKRAGISGVFHSTIIRSAHSTSETKIAGLPNFAPH